MENGILVVDDERENIKAISHLLKEMGFGKRIYSAPNGKIALSLAKKYLLDLVLTDWEMPEMDGLELVKALKAEESTKDVPIIMVTGVMIEAVSLKEAFDAGVHDFLRKPFNDLEFVARIQATLKLQNAYLTIKESKEEIARQAGTIKAQHAELDEANKLKDKILSIISHDMRSPLNTLNGLIWVMNEADESISESYQKHLAGIQSKINTVQSFLDNLLFWAKTQLEEIGMEVEEFEIRNIADEVYRLFSDRFAQKQITFYNQLNGQQVQGDYNMLAFIVRNLIDNALKFTPEKGRITISAQEAVGKIQLFVEDTGIGMAAEVRDKLFRNDAVISQLGTSGEKGTGLGLKLCRDFAQMHGGKLEVFSELNKGSIFVLTLPYVKELLADA